VAFINRVCQAYGTQIQIKLDACWGDALPNVPRLFAEDDCGAGDAILSITSDKRIKLCSFHHVGIPFETIDDVRQFWEQQRIVRDAARIVGCARLPNRGSELIKGSGQGIQLAAVGK
jgi:hypothetical protein